jgi:hypothetical protein
MLWCGIGAGGAGVVAAGASGDGGSLLGSPFLAINMEF